MANLLGLWALNDHLYYVPPLPPAATARRLTRAPFPHHVIFGHVLIKTLKLHLLIRIRISTRPQAIRSRILSAVRFADTNSSNWMPSHFSSKTSHQYVRHASTGCTGSYLLCTCAAPQRVRVSPTISLIGKMKLGSKAMRWSQNRLAVGVVRVSASLPNATRGTQPPQLERPQRNPMA